MQNFFPADTVETLGVSVFPANTVETLGVSALVYTSAADLEKNTPNTGDMIREMIHPTAGMAVSKLTTNEHTTMATNQTM